MGQSPAASDVAAVLRQSFCMEIPLLPEFRTPKASGTRLFKGWAALVEPEKLTMRIGDKVDLPPGVDRLPKSVSLKSWIGQLFLNPPPRPFQFIVFTAPKIGRESCRERVCPYVSIAVVAGSLEKKKKNN